LGRLSIGDTDSARTLTIVSDQPGHYLWPALNADGRYLAWFAENAVHIWDARTATNVSEVATSHSSMRMVLSPDGSCFAATFREKDQPWDVVVWDCKTGRLLTRLDGHTGAITCIAFSPDGRRIATGSADKTAVIWDVESGKELLTLRGHREQVRSLAFSSDGLRLATGSYGTMRIWDVRPFDPAE
jgi:WD40 repeat protein